VRPRKLIKSGSKYGKLTVIGVHDVKEGPSKSKVFCECGKTKVVRNDALKEGKTKSCGCSINLTHGQSRTGKITIEFHTWCSMIKRCTNRNCEDYKYYGARGIKVCERWLKFENFFEDMGIKPKDLTLERIDTNGNYCKENCKWATHSEQVANRRPYKARNRYSKINEAK